MTDRELLEAAARAAGVFMTPNDWPYSDPHTPEDFALEFDEGDGSITGTRVWHGGNGDVGGTEKYTWHPLTDDGDALRLAVKLHIGVRSHGPDHWQQPNVTVALWDFGEQAGRVTVAHGDDPQRSTRRAIVHAAAEIARATHKEGA